MFKTLETLKSLKKKDCRSEVFKKEDFDLRKKAPLS